MRNAHKPFRVNLRNLGSRKREDGDLFYVYVKLLKCNISAMTVYEVQRNVEAKETGFNVEENNRRFSM